MSPPLQRLRVPYSQQVNWKVVSREDTARAANASSERCDFTGCSKSLIYQDMLNGIPTVKTNFSMFSNFMGSLADQTRRTRSEHNAKVAKILTSDTPT